MISHHPSNEMLMEHAAGTLSWAFSLGVTAHLQMCTQCRQQIHQLNKVGGGLLDSASPEQPAPSGFNRLIGKIEQIHEQESFITHSPADKPPFRDSLRPNGNRGDLLPVDMPKVVRKLLSESSPLRWRRVLPALRVAQVTSNSTSDSIALYRIPSGGQITEHNHRGPEATLVLSGSFSDAHGLYSAGDFLAQEAGEVHKPTATQDQPCIFLAISQAPIVPTGICGWVAHRFTTAIT
jgi:putative transcriptional regulator